MEKLIRDGVVLAHETRGQADPPILLVHGWTCDHTYFDRQAEHFSRNHRVISVDLRGHGESDKREQDYTMAGYADDIAWLCGQLAAAKPVIIGHSMGGVMAFEVVARHAAAQRQGTWIAARRSPKDQGAVPASHSRPDRWRWALSPAGGA